MVAKRLGDEEAETPRGSRRRGGFRPLWSSIAICTRHSMCRSPVSHLASVAATDHRSCSLTLSTPRIDPDLLKDLRAALAQYDALLGSLESGKTLERIRSIPGRAARITELASFRALADGSVKDQFCHRVHPSSRASAAHEASARTQAAGSRTTGSRCAGDAFERKIQRPTRLNRRPRMALRPCRCGW